MGRPNSVSVIFVENNGLNALSMASGAIPAPVSAHSAADVSETVTVRLPSAGMACTAFSTTFVSGLALMCDRLAQQVGASDEDMPQL